MLDAPSAEAMIYNGSYLNTYGEWKAFSFKKQMLVGFEDLDEAANNEQLAPLISFQRIYKDMCHFVLENGNLGYFKQSETARKVCMIPNCKQDTILVMCEPHREEFGKAFARKWRLENVNNENEQFGLVKEVLFEMLAKREKEMASLGLYYKHEVYYFQKSRACLLYQKEILRRLREREHLSQKNKVADDLVLLTIQYIDEMERLLDCYYTCFNVAFIRVFYLFFLVCFGVNGCNLLFCKQIKKHESLEWSREKIDIASWEPELKDTPFVSVLSIARGNPNDEDINKFEKWIRSLMIAARELRNAFFEVFHSNDNKDLEEKAENDMDASKKMYSKHSSGYNNAIKMRLDGLVESANYQLAVSTVIEQIDLDYAQDLQAKEKEKERQRRVAQLQAQAAQGQASQSQARRDEWHRQ